MPRVERIPASGYDTLPNFIIQRQRVIKAMVGHTVPSSVSATGGEIVAVSADARGDRMVRPGTVVYGHRTGASGAFSGTFYPATAAVAVAANVTTQKRMKAMGIVVGQLNLRGGDRIASILVDGWVDEKWVSFIDLVKGKKPADAILAVFKADLPEVKFDANVGVLHTNS